MFYWKAFLTRTDRSRVYITHTYHASSLRRLVGPIYTHDTCIHVTHTGVVIIHTVPPAFTVCEYNDKSAEQVTAVGSNPLVFISVMASLPSRTVAFPYFAACVLLFFLEENSRTDDSHVWQRIDHMEKCRHGRWIWIMYVHMTRKAIIMHIYMITAVPWRTP